MPEPTVAPTPAARDPEEILGSAVEATAALDSFHFDVAVVLSFKSEESSIELPIELTGDYSAPNMFRSTVTMNLGFLTIETEIVDTGESMYVKDPESGAWIVEESADTAVLVNPSDFIDLEAMNLRDVNLAGTETLDGAEHYVIEAVADDPFDAGLNELPTTIWVRVADGLIGQIRSEGDISLGDDEPIIPGLGGDAGMALTMRLSDYNQPVTIEAPVQPGTATAPQPVPQSTAEPLTDHSSLFLFTEAMAAVESAHVEGELALKESADAETALLLQRFTGDGELNGDNQMAGTMDVNTGGFAGSFPFETRRVGGIDYSKDPAAGQWATAPPGNPSILNDLFDPAIIGVSDLVDPVVTRETLDGGGVFRVEGAVDSELPIARKVLWIGDEDHLLRQVYLEGAMPASAFPGLASGDEIHVSLTARYSQYNEPVNVTAP